MPRVRRGVTARSRHRKIVERAKGFRGRRSSVFRVAKQAVLKAEHYATRDRRRRKRDFRQLWIMRINAAARAQGLSYSRFMSALSAAGVRINRKILAELSVNDQPSFTALANLAKAQS